VIAIIDYGMGNVGSMANMLKKIGAEATITADPVVIASADKLILPGVGAFDHGMRELHARSLVPVIREQVVENGKKLLGVCLGMQLLTEGSDEGRCEGLGWLPGRTVRFLPSGESGPRKVPHMGWNLAEPVRDDPLFAGLDSDARFYFVHSYHVSCDNGSVLATTNYGGPFVSAIRKGNIAGVQFHPEKSHRFGMQLLRNFAGSA
jgi:glutamine amidotransferase